ncbi:MAG TPA: DUF2314 domain-containing protein [Phycisphaerales bacterium]|nr:DUF2314 domain-containing protein [Phycisphaerales bacterium]
MRKFVFIAAITATLMGVASCEARKHDNVVSFKEDDAGMAAAIAQARQTTDTFLARLNQPSTPNDYVAVKIALPTTDGSLEHIWCGNVQFANGVFTATIANDPRDTQYKFGQQVTAPKAEISDWMYVQDGKLVGGYTIRYMHSTMTPDEQTKFREGMPFRFE